MHSYAQWWLTSVAAFLAFAAWRATPSMPQDAPAAEEEERVLMVGDPAPPMNLNHWIMGVELDERRQFTPVTTFQPGTIYALDFWATWCAPCLEAIPHLSDLQEKYRDVDVRVIAVTNETLPQVFGWLTSSETEGGRPWHDRITYTVAADPDGSFREDYFFAARQTRIPCAFVIGADGLITWIGKAQAGLDEAIEAIEAAVNARR